MMSESQGAYSIYFSMDTANNYTLPLDCFFDKYGFYMYFFVT